MYARSRFIDINYCVVYAEFPTTICCGALTVLFKSTEKPTVVTMGVLLEAAVLIAASLSIYARIVGATYLTVILVLISCSAVQLALFLAYHSLIHRWFVVATKVLPHPKVDSHVLLRLNSYHLLADRLSLEHFIHVGQLVALSH